MTPEVTVMEQSIPHDVPDVEECLHSGKATPTDLIRPDSGDDVRG